MSKNHFTGTATQSQLNRKFYQLNKDQYCTYGITANEYTDSFLAFLECIVFLLAEFHQTVMYQNVPEYTLDKPNVSGMILNKKGSRRRKGH